jgi:lipopolysaccharide/colanic/teichoic acid biosynthesis glycosyltransferase
MFAQLMTMKSFAIGGYVKEEPYEDRRFPPFSEDLFAKLLSLERKRAERSRRPFVLMLLDAAKLLQADQSSTTFGRLAIALFSSTRETDICGWYRKGSVIGVIFTEVGSTDTNGLRTMIFSKIDASLRANLEPRHVDEIRISLHVFPDDPGLGTGGSVDSRTYLYPDLHRVKGSKEVSRLIKRGIDIVGSLTALTLLSPLFLAIAVAIKLTSKGPVLFKQQRVGRCGVGFTFLKFRSMYYANDATIHQDYVRQFISGKDDCKQADRNGGAYKLTRDPRITSVGQFLRKTSLDELPQFWNVLRGEMSLVGPRPPIPYEIEVYDIWHRRRFLEITPGITGLWQVMGRSRLKFDEMVRLDLKYARDWSLWLDLKILLATPRAVFFGEGAY